MNLRLIFFILLAPALLQAADQDELFTAANQAYAGGRYEQAAQLYQQIVTQTGYSSALCLNLGNAELKAGHLGLALLNYERARYLAPADAGIDHNLQLARKQAGLQPDSYRWWQIMLRALPVDVWWLIMDAWLVLLGFAILLSATVPRLAFLWPVPRWRRLLKAVFFVSIPAFLFSGYLALLGTAATERVEGVVIVKISTLHLSPFASSDTLGTLSEGELVTVDQKHLDYVRIHAREERSGWLPRKEVEPIIPGNF